MLSQRLASARAEDDLVVVPTSSLYRGAGRHPSAAGGLQVAAPRPRREEGAGRGAARRARERTAGGQGSRGRVEDPDIEKKIVIEGSPAGTVVDAKDGRPSLRGLPRRRRTRDARQTAAEGIGDAPGAKRRV